MVKERGSFFWLFIAIVIIFVVYIFDIGVGIAKDEAFELKEKGSQGEIHGLHELLVEYNNFMSFKHPPKRVNETLPKRGETKN